MQETATVNVKSSFKSKINWAQGITAFAIMVSMFGFDVSAEEQAALVTVIALAGNAVTWIARTWFTKSVTIASAE